MSNKNKSYLYIFSKSDLELCKEYKATHYYKTTRDPRSFPILYRYKNGVLQRLSKDPIQWKDYILVFTDMENLVIIPYPECKRKTLVPVKDDLNTVISQMMEGNKYYNIDGSVVYEFNPERKSPFMYTFDDGTNPNYIFDLTVFDIDNWYEIGYTFLVKNFKSDPRELVIEKLKLKLGDKELPNDKLVNTILDEDIPLSHILEVSRSVLELHLDGQFKQY